MGGSPKQQGPTTQERALAADGAHKWNDYVKRYVPLENEFVNRTTATRDKIASARNMVNADAAMAYGGAVGQAQVGLASQGVAPGAGRAAMGLAALGDVRAGAGGLGQAEAAQGVRDREQAARVKMSAFGRDLQDNTSVSLSNSGRRATATMLDSYASKLDSRQSMIRSGVSLAGAGVSGYNAYLAGKAPPSGSMSLPQTPVGLSQANQGLANYLR